jgi:nucleotide-binding universal stress UspA family protein
MILLCYDGSDDAKRAIAVAHATLGHKPATVLYVWRPPGEFLAPDPYGAVSTPPGPPIVELERLALERAETLAHEGFELARGHGFAVEARTERSDASVWRTILDVADEVDAETVVVGARGLSTVASALLGSVSNAVVHHSGRPVLVIPRGSR